MCENSELLSVKGEHENSLQKCLSNEKSIDAFWWKFWFEKKDKSTILNRMVRGGGRRRNRFKRVRRVFLRYFIVAVAVSAMIGVFGQIVLHSPTFLYDDLKVCPQVEMQCASSTTRNPMLRFAYARARSDLNVCVESISGEQ